jgi:hypothetical protein
VRFVDVIFAISLGSGGGARVPRLKKEIILPPVAQVYIDNFELSRHNIEVERKALLEVLRSCPTKKQCICVKKRLNTSAHFQRLLSLASINEVF